EEGGPIGFPVCVLLRVYVPCTAIRVISWEQLDGELARCLLPATATVEAAIQTRPLVRGQERAVPEAPRLEDERVLTALRVEGLGIRALVTPIGHEHVGHPGEEVTTEGGVQSDLANELHGATVHPTERPAWCFQPDRLPAELGGRDGNRRAHFVVGDHVLL